MDLNELHEGIRETLQRLDLLLKDIVKQSENHVYSGL